MNGQYLAYGNYGPYNYQKSDTTEIINKGMKQYANLLTLY